MAYSLLVILLVLVIDRLIPDRGGLNLFLWFDDWIDSVEQRFNGGESRHGLAALGLTVGSVFLVALLVQGLLAAINPLLRFGLDLLILILLIQLNRNFQLAAQIAAAIEADDASEADEILEGLPSVMDEPVSDANIIWITSARMLAGLNSWLFAPIFWFVLLGPAGAILFVIAGIASRKWDWRNAQFQEFGRAAQYLYQGLIWLPVRLLAISYALLGNFEQVLLAWRMQRDIWSGSSDQLLVTVGLGALDQGYEDRNPDTDLLQRTVALLYRVILFWGVVAALLIMLDVLG